MIARFVAVWDAHKEEVAAGFAAKEPSSYKDVVTAVVRLLHDHTEDDYGEQPDPERIVEIDHGDYQGTLLYVIGATGYQPSTYWAVSVGYGSCSGCDTLCGIIDSADDDKVPQYVTLALHVVQGLKKISGYGDDE